MSVPQISVVVPNRNQRAFLPERFDTLAAQTRGDYEVIVVDGHSDDGSWEYIQERAARDPRLRILQAEPRGPYAAWNLGLREARGGLLHIATADDAMAPSFLEKMAAALERRPECGVAHCRLRIVDALGDPAADCPAWERLPLQRHYFGAWTERAHLRPAPHDGLLHTAAGTVTTSVNQLLFRRRVTERAGFFREDLGPAADFEWGMRVGLLEGTVHVPETLALWRRHPGQLTRDADDALPSACRAKETMIREALRAAAAVDPALGRFDPERLALPMRHQALLSDPSLGMLDRWQREPSLIALDLKTRWRWKGNFHRAHIAWVKKELRRLGVPGPVAE